MAVKTIEKMREYNIALFQSIKDIMLNTTRYRRDYQVQETFTCLDGQDYDTYILEFSGPNASAKVTINENINVEVNVDTLFLRNKCSYRYFNINDFAVDGKVVMDFKTYRVDTMRLFKYLFEEAYIMPYDNRSRVHQPCYDFWTLKFLKEYSFSNITELERWLSQCIDKHVLRKKDIVVPIDCIEDMLERMVQRNELSENAYVIIRNGLRSDRCEALNSRYF